MGSILALLKKLKLREAAVNSLTSLIINDLVIILLNILSLYLLIYESRLVIVLIEYYIHELSKLSMLILPY
jgi:hypothetical protein